MSNWATRCALLARIKQNDSNFNKGFGITGGRAAVIPILGVAATTGAAGVADANELTADTLSVTNGFTQAEYNFTHMRMPLTLRNSEKKLLSGPKGAYRGNIVDGKIMQMTSSFRELIETNFAADAVDSRTAQMGVRYAIGHTNSTVGGIDQNAQSWWRGNQIAVGGAISLLNLDNAIHTINTKADGTGKCGAPDLAIAYYSSTLDIYGRIHALINPAERIVNAQFKAEYGFLNFNYRGIDFVMSQRIASGEIQVLSSDSWYYGGDEMPYQAVPDAVIPGTDSIVKEYTMWNFLGVDQPRVNCLLTGITG